MPQQKDTQHIRQLQMILRPAMDLTSILRMAEVYNLPISLSISRLFLRCFFCFFGGFPEAPWILKPA